MDKRVSLLKPTATRSSRGMAIAPHDMLMPMREDKPKRPPPFSYRPPQEKREDFARRVAESGLTVNGFITQCVFGRNRHRPAEMRKLAEILSRCAEIADVLRDMQLSGTSNNTLALDHMLEELRMIRTSLMSLMGRRS